LFDKDLSKSDWMALAAVSVALSIPMIFIMKNMSDSLQAIAEKLSSEK